MSSVDIALLAALAIAAGYVIALAGIAYAAIRALLALTRLARRVDIR